DAIGWRTRFHRNCEETSRKLVTQRKVIWQHNRIRTNQANLTPPARKVARSKIAKDRSVSVNSATVRDRAVNRVAAVNQADAKTGYRRLTSGGRKLRVARRFYVFVSIGCLNPCGASLFYLDNESG